MTGKLKDILDIQTAQEELLRLELDNIHWEDILDYGSVKIQIRNGKPTLVTIERTVKLD